MPDTAHDFRTYVEENLDALGTDPGRVALVHQGRRVTAGEFRALVHRMARAMRKQGIDRGRTVTLLSGNLPETVAARYAANLIGCRVNHLYNKLSADVQATIVTDVETAALIVDPRFDDRAAELTALAPVPTVLTLGPAKTGTDLLELASAESDEPVPSGARPEDICTIRHTGGTTGHPKGICTTYGQVRTFVADDDEDAGDAKVLWERPADQEGNRLLVCTTLAHAAGMMADVTLREHGLVVLLEDFDPAEVLATIEREKITHLFLLPPLLYRLTDHPDAATTDTSSLRCLTYGGCQSSPARIADAIRRFGPVLVQFYGQNEAGGISVLPAEDHDPDNLERLRSAGRILPNVEVAVRDENGRDLPRGEHGEICIRSASIMQGYWKQPELTAEVLRDGWLHTGDIGFLDADDYLTIVDRIKDMIVVVGGHVYTTELEDLLNSHPGVLQSAVFGVRDEDRMEQVYATVVLADGADVDADQLRAMVREARGAMYEPAHIEFVEQLPLTDAGKPDKKQLRAQATRSAA
ncbi:fatty acid--CoA ligase [Streptomyces rimosus subsp. pseudoverticillatus]|uniref:AMP-binding protein n=1 Tax=Streptomyces rimosus TaxID=1927 RepID=UPI0006B284D2|nr:AMP-binding protein [Streptomyces rimosus]KOT81205.1 fatty acid--CoA ligase [Streptomyces rimosus subsp. pseudoverticillatus]